MKQAWVWVCVIVTLGCGDMLVWAQQPPVGVGGSGKSVGDMAQEAQTDILAATGLISVLFYVVGAVLVGFGLLKLKRHSDQPQQVTLGSGLMWMVIGVALIVAPFIIGGIAETFGVSAGGSGPDIKPPKLN